MKKMIVVAILSMVVFGAFAQNAYTPETGITIEPSMTFVVSSTDPMYFEGAKNGFASISFMDVLPFDGGMFIEVKANLDYSIESQLARGMASLGGFKQFGNITAGFNANGIWKMGSTLSLPQFSSVKGYVKIHF